MSARKLGRIAGLVFVLAVAFGGATAAAAGEIAGGSATAVESSQPTIDWD